MRELENEGIRKKGTSYKLAPAEGTFQTGSDRLEEGLEDSEGNRKERKRAERSFSEKRV